MLAISALPSLADGRTEKYRSNGCEIERKFDDDKYETKVECKPGYGRARFGGAAGKEEFRQGGCEIKREWKADGEYKEEVKCR
jgi:hypothetical protein